MLHLGLLDRLGCRGSLLVLVPEGRQQGARGGEKNAATISNRTSVGMKKSNTYQRAMLRPQIVLPWKQLVLVAPAQFQTVEPGWLHSFIFWVAEATNA
jgi:hypothetical protein